MTAQRIVGAGFLLVTLGGFFLWVLLQMASASESMERLGKMGAAFGAIALAALLAAALIRFQRR